MPSGANSPIPWRRTSGSATPAIEAKSPMTCRGGPAYASPGCCSYVDDDGNTDGCLPGLTYWLFVPCALLTMDGTCDGQPDTQPGGPPVLVLLDALRDLPGFGTSTHADFEGERYAICGAVTDVLDQDCRNEPPAGFEFTNDDCGELDPLSDNGPCSCDVILTIDDATGNPVPLNDGAEFNFGQGNVAVSYSGSTFCDITTTNQLGPSSSTFYGSYAGFWQPVPGQNPNWNYTGTYNYEGLDYYHAAEYPFGQFDAQAYCLSITPVTCSFEFTNAHDDPNNPCCLPGDPLGVGVPNFAGSAVAWADKWENMGIGAVNGESVGIDFIRPGPFRQDCNDPYEIDGVPQCVPGGSRCNQSPTNIASSPLRFFGPSLAPVLDADPGDGSAAWIENANVDVVVSVNLNPVGGGGSVAITVSTSGVKKYRSIPWEDENFHSDDVDQDYTCGLTGVREATMNVTSVTSKLSFWGGVCGSVEYVEPECPDTPAAFF